MALNKKKAGLSIGGLVLAAPIVAGFIAWSDTRNDERYPSKAELQETHIKVAANANAIQCDRLKGSWYQILNEVFFLQEQLRKYPSNDAFRKKLFHAENKQHQIEKDMRGVKGCFVQSQVF